MVVTKGGAVNGLTIPRDDRLPGLATLLDTEKILALVRSNLPHGEDGTMDCRRVWVRYNPGRNCIATYVITAPNRQPASWYGECLPKAEFLKACQELQREPRLETSEKSGQVPAVIQMPEAGMLLFAYPNDRRLRSLRTVACDDGAGRFLNQHLYGPGHEAHWKTTVVRYKPESRAVLRCEQEPSARAQGEPKASPGASVGVGPHELIEDSVGPGLSRSEGRTVYLRVYPDARQTGVFPTLRELEQWLGPSAPFLVPPLLALDSERHLVAHGSLSGDRLGSTLGTGRARDAFVRTAEALAFLHAYENPRAPRRTTADHLNEADRALDRVSQFAPETVDQAKEIHSRLHAQTPEESSSVCGFTHGDFHDAQVLVDEGNGAGGSAGHGTIRFLDFDQAHLGPVLADVGKLLAHLHYIRMRDQRPDARDAADAFLEAYARAAPKRRLGIIPWWIAVSLLQIAIKPIRRLDPHASVKAKTLLDDAIRVLDTVDC